MVRPQLASVLSIISRTVRLSLPVPPERIPEPVLSRRFSIVNHDRAFQTGDRSPIDFSPKNVSEFQADDTKETGGDGFEFTMLNYLLNESPIMSHAIEHAKSCEVVTLLRKRINVSTPARLTRRSKLVPD